MLSCGEKQFDIYLFFVKTKQNKTKEIVILKHISMNFKRG